MGAIDDFINNLLGSQSNPLTQVNSNEFNGNSNDLLFQTDLSASTLSVAGGTTLTNIAPAAALNDALSGKLTTPVIVWVVILGALFWWVMKR